MASLAKPMRRLSYAQRTVEDADEPKTVDLIHHGRKSGNAYTTKLWFVQLDGYYWVGSLNPKRSWVHNVKASGHAQLDFGNGPKQYKCYWVVNSRELAAYSKAVRKKYPVMSRLVSTFNRGGKQIAFRLEPVF